MNLNPADEQFLARLRTQVPDRVFKEPESKYFSDPRGLVNGRVAPVLAPENTAQVSAIITAANNARIGVVPFGGGTGLVGGQLKPDGPTPVILSLERLTKIRDTSVGDAAMVVDAGAILQDVQRAAADAGMLFPLSLASQGSCRIGGNLATNAGGVNVLRYGNARDLCLGLEAVLATGEIWHGLKRLRKDNTGYDLKNLLIGSEGTLGVITAASLRLFPQTPNHATALIVVNNPTAALQLLGCARQQVGETISAFELIDGTGLEFLTETMPEIRQPFVNVPRWSVLIDVGFSGDGDPNAALGAIFEIAQEQGLASDGLIAQSERQHQDIWTLRESIPEANKRIASITSNDISLPLGAIADFIIKGREAIAQQGVFRINSFGHLGDGNLHYNIFPPPGGSRADYPGLGGKLRRIVHDLVAEFDGSFSAEHGVGRAKTNDLKRYSDAAKFNTMIAIKRALDPNGIMNPGALFR